MPLLRGPGAAGGAHRETGRPAAAGGGRPGQPGVTGGDLAALRARLASLEARPARPARPQPRPQPGLPPDCRWEETPHGQVAIPEEWVPGRDDDLAELTALATCLGFAPSDLDRPVYLDTETTGLSGGTGTVPFLVGLAWAEGEGL